MGDNKEEYELQLSINNYENSEIITSIILGIIDLVCIILFSLYLKTKKKAVKKLKKKLLQVFLFDFISRLLYTNKYSSWIICKELIFSFVDCIQFYLIISFLSSILEKSKKRNQIKIFPLSVLFFFITFSYEKFFFLPSKYFFQIRLDKLIVILQSTCILLCIYKSYENIKKYIYEITKSLKCKNQQLGRAYLFIEGSFQTCLFLFTIYYILKLSFIFINNPIFIIYSQIILNIQKEAVKYFVFCICLVIFYQYRDYKNIEEKNKDLDEIEKLVI